MLTPNRPTIYNAANEFAVSRFLDHKLSYPGIIEAIEASLDHVGFVQNPNVDNILAVSYTHLTLPTTPYV